MSLNQGFLIGAATAAHQVEGNNIYSDFWAQEHMEHSLFKEPSLNAVDHYHRFREDIDLLASAGLNAFRFSIEWARVEPQKDCFDEAEIRHYKEVLKYCREKKLTPIVTLHHFSSPLWLIQEGGWESEIVVDRFRRYALCVVEHLHDYMEYICTINEANMGLALSVIRRSHTQGKNADLQVGINISDDSAETAAQRVENAVIFGTETPQTFLEMRTEQGDALILRAHCAARDSIKRLFPELKVGLTLSLHDFQPEAGAEAQAKEEWDRQFSHYIPSIQNDDFVGVQNYTRKLVGKAGFLPTPSGARITQMFYEFYPQSLANVVRKVTSQLSIPVLITENGVATANDAERIEFIQEALSGVFKCVSDNLPVVGYLYWSLMDNFEWQKGYDITFGLIAVDRTTQKRYPKASLCELAKCYQNWRKS